ncbi:hypothetical protein D4R30_00175 [archaeon]|nr:MAG: hypothetical protein D4R30_00175 [archaeon]
MKPYRALLDRELDLDCWRGALVIDGDWITDGRVCFSACAVIGPYIARAEKLMQVKAQDDRIRSQDEADRLMEAIETTPLARARELGWYRETVRIGKARIALDVMYVESDEIVLPLLVDYVRLLKSFVDYDEVRISNRRDRPAGFFRHNELVAICTPLALP